MIDDYGRALLSDIGHELVVADANLNNAETHSSCRWTAPEVLLSPNLSSEIYTTNADIYSFAMTALEVR